MSETPDHFTPQAPTAETVDPYADLPVEDGVGFQDPDATELDPEVSK